MMKEYPSDEKLCFLRSVAVVAFMRLDEANEKAKRSADSLCLLTDRMNSSSYAGRDSFRSTFAAVLTEHQADMSAYFEELRNWQIAVNLADDQEAVVRQQGGAT